MDGKRKQALQELNKAKSTKQKRTEQLAEEMDELDSDEEKLLQSSSKPVQRMKRKRPVEQVNPSKSMQQFLMKKTNSPKNKEVQQQQAKEEPSKGFSKKDFLSQLDNIVEEEDEEMQDISQGQDEEDEPMEPMPTPSKSQSSSQTKPAPTIQSSTPSKASTSATLLSKPTPKTSRSEHSDFANTEELKKKQKTDHTSIIVAPKRTSIIPTSESLPSIPVYTHVETSGLFNPNSESIEMFLLDACENTPGTLFLFGKVKTSKGFVSCCVTVENLERFVYLYPRKKILENGKEGAKVEIAHIKEEVAKLTRSQGILQHKFKSVKRNYAFEEASVPISFETDFIKVRYPASIDGRVQSQLALKSDNRIFAHAFGSNTTCLENFILKRKVKGPCWITIKNAKLAKVKFSWCKYEFVVDDYKNISPSMITVAPPLTVISLKIKAMLNEAEKTNDIIAASIVAHTNINCDGPTNDLEKGFRKFNVIRKIDKTLKYDENSRSNYELCQTEKQLLEALISKLKELDPDIIVGHNFLAYDLDILLHRMKALNVGKEWSLIGRLSRSTIPKLQTGAGGMSESTREEKAVLSGRLVCDTYLASKEYLREKVFSLQNLALTQLNAKKYEIDDDFSSLRPYFENKATIGTLLSHVETDAYLSFLLMYKLSLLPLTKELSNIAGNMWSRTLSGSRAERIEYLLLHEFHAKKFIVPDKYGIKSHQEGNSNKKKAAYAGGLVFEPQKGLYDKYVLLLDFNSLYPSIILEHNICFTTVKRNRGTQEKEEESSVVDSTDPTYEKSVLPGVIKSLVEKRRTVKNQLKYEKEEARKWQLDNKQKALKLTANSTYGCLGFQMSRFYCKPIAELITRSGRNILMQTKTEIEKLNKTVIYGDTDSVMVLTTFDNFFKALELGEQIKQHINKNHKYLEIDIDGLFRRILLLKKKKYVAILESLDPFDRTKIVRKVEKKGLDMVRRDWCELSRDASQFCVDAILSGAPTEDVVNNIHQKLKELSTQVKQGQIPIEKVILTKGLNKAPEEYPDAKSHPHVMVALQMRKKGQAVRVGQRIEYVICTTCSKAEQSAQHSTIAERAFHPDEVAASNGALQIDWDWVLEQQVFPPVKRLCEHMQGTDTALLAECLGLDKSKFRGTVYTENDENYVMMNYKKSDEKELYKNCVLSQLTCEHCKQQIEFSNRNLCESIIKSAVLRRDGQEKDSTLRFFDCDKCKKKIHPCRVKNHIIRNIQQVLEKYYLGKMTFRDDEAQIGVVSLTPNYAVTGGKIVSSKLVFSAQDLHLHLQYYSFLFDWENAKMSALERSKSDSNLPDYVKVLISKFEIMEDVAHIQNIFKYIQDKYLELCGRRYVDLQDLFKIN